MKSNLWRRTLVSFKLMSQSPLLVCPSQNQSSSVCLTLSLSSIVCLSLGHNHLSVTLLKCHLFVHLLTSVVRLSISLSCFLCCFSLYIKLSVCLFVPVFVCSFIHPCLVYVYVGLLSNFIMTVWLCSTGQWKMKNCDKPFRTLSFFGPLELATYWVIFDTIKLR